MKITRLLLFSLLILAWCTSAYAQAEDTAKPGPVILTDGQDEYPLGLHLEILEDPGGELAIEEVASPEFDSRFVPSQDEVPNYGFTDSAYWVRLRLRNETLLDSQWLLDVGFANMQFVDLYSPSQSGERFDVKQSGSLRHASTRDIRHRDIVFVLTLPAQSQQTYYLRFQSGASMTLPLTLWTVEAFSIRTQVELVLHGLFYGALIALLAYHVFLALSLRETSYLFFVFLLASLLVATLSYYGYLETYLFPELYSLKTLYFPLSISLLLGSIVLFSNAFLELRTQYPVLHRANMVLAVGWGVLFFLTPFVSYHILAILMSSWALISLVAELIAGITTWRQRRRNARFFLIAWFGVLASFSLLFLVRQGRIPSTVFSENVYLLGFIWMAVCWSIALADRINVLKAETEDAYHDLQNSERRLSEILQGLPLGVAVYGKDQKPTFANRRVTEILCNPAQDIQPDLSAGRTLDNAMKYYSIRVSGSDQDYPLEKMPIYRALQGEPASIDDAEADLVDRKVPLEIWASPVKNDAGEVELAVVAFQDITQRKKTEAELEKHHKHLESLVEKRTAELSATNEWLSTLKRVRQSVSGTADLPQAYDKLFDSILQLFDARAVILLRWDSPGGQIKTICHRHRDDSIHVLDGFASIIKNDPTLQKEIESGESIHLPADRVASLPASSGELLREDGIQSLLLMPMIAGQSVVGVLGLMMPQPMGQITRAQTELIKTISIDLANLAEGAQLLDQSQALVVAEERNSLAGELHDSVTQILFSASMLAEATPRIWDKDQGIARMNLEKLSVLLRGALAEMRSLLFELRSGEPQGQSLEKLLTTLVEAVRARTQIDISLKMIDESTLPENVIQSFYRITREALNNVIVHSGATRVTISLLNKEQGAELHIQDNGYGFGQLEIPTGHLGIDIMTERATQIGGDLQIISEPGQGTEVVVTWPGTGGETGEDG